MAVAGLESLKEFLVGRDRGVRHVVMEIPQTEHLRPEDCAPDLSNELNGFADRNPSMPARGTRNPNVAVINPAA